MRWHPCGHTEDFGSRSSVRTVGWRRCSWARNGSTFSGSGNPDAHQSMDIVANRDRLSACRCLRQPALSICRSQCASRGRVRIRSLIVAFKEIRGLWQVLYGYQRIAGTRSSRCPFGVAASAQCFRSVDHAKRRDAVRRPNRACEHFRRDHRCRQHRPPARYDRTSARCEQRSSRRRRIVDIRNVNDRRWADVKTLRATVTLLHRQRSPLASL